MENTQIRHRYATAAVRALALGAAAVGALAIGTAAVGAFALGVFNIRRLRRVEGKLKELHVGRLTIDELEIKSKRES
jgi:hypothetical protein